MNRPHINYKQTPTSSQAKQTSHINPFRPNNQSKRSKSTTPRLSFTIALLFVLLTQILLIYPSLGDQLAKRSSSQASVSSAKPSISLIVPQSFKLAVNQLLAEHNHRPTKQQYVAVINNVQSERENNLLRQQFKRLSLQIRDARHPKTGQLFYEHVFDYFNQDSHRHHLLVPVNLENVSFSTEEHVPHSSASRSAKAKRPTLRQVIVSVRTIQDKKPSSDGVELVSSAPILIDTVHSHDGRHSFGFVQTDKPIYKPTDKVRIRAMVINEEFRPVVRDEFKIQVKNNQNIVVEEVRFPDYNQTSKSTAQKSTSQEPVFFDHVFEFPPEPMLGQWTVNLIHHDVVANDTVSFQVKEYILPSFEVQFQSCKYILPWTKNVSGHLIAKYHYGKPVHGTLSLKYGLKESLQSAPKYVGRSDFKTIDPNTGRVNFTLGLDRYRDHMWFPQVSGSYFVVEATVTNETSGHMEVIQDTNCRFVSLPYKISFDKSIEYFKPGLSQQLTVSVVEYNTDLPPPMGSRLVAEYRDKNDRLLSSSISQTPAAMVRSSTILSIVETSRQFTTAAITDATGKATFKIGPIIEDVAEIRVKIKFLNPNQEVVGRNEYSQELASAEYTLKRHDSKHGWLSIMNKGQTRLNVNDIFSSELLVDNAPLKPSRTYFMIIARGEIVDLRPLSSDGLVEFKVTENMVPSIRLLVFGLRQDSLEMLSDSMRIDVGQTLACGLRLKFDSTITRNEKTFRPNEQVTLAIEARPGDHVSLVGVDSAVYTLKSQNILESNRVIERVRLLDPGCGFGDGLNSIDVFLNAGLMFFSSAADTTNSVPIVGSSCSSIANQQKQLLDMKYGYSRPSLSAPSKSWGREIGNLLSRLTTFGRSERMKRALNSEILLENYSDSKDKACCLLGTYEDTPKARSCDIRAEIVQKHMEPIGYANCSEIYLYCCKSISENLLTSALITGRSSIVQEAHIVAERANELFSAKDLTNLGSLAEIEDQTFVRTDFRETWLFDVVKVDPSDGRASIDVKLAHSITSWTVSALALNLNEPMCIMPQPVKLTTFQEIILQLTMPYKVIESEQIDLVATVFNYSPEQQEVFIYMYGIQDVCSEAEPGERSDRVREIIPPNSFSSVIFPIIPMRIGKFKIKVLAITKSIELSDIVEKELNVVSKGRPVTEETTFKLDPMNQQRRNKRSIQAGNLLDDIDESKGLQRSKIRLAPQHQQNFDNIVPKTQQCIVSAIGHRLGQSLQTTLLDVENLIRLPHGCGEQVMIYFGPTLYTLRYLSSLNRLTGDSRWRAIRYMQSGYKRVLNYRKDSGAFSAFTGREPSKWLTAFVAKLLCQAEHTSGVANELRIDRNAIISALNWLIDHQDNSTGSWSEENPVYHREMLGGVLKENALTAFVTITLEECSLVDFKPSYKSHSETESVDPSIASTSSALSIVDRLRLATQRAEASLVKDRHRALQKKNPYVLAMTAYALSFSKPSEAHATLEDLMTLAEKSVARNQLYWRGQYAIETGAYALQTIVQLAPYLVDRIGQTGGSSHWFAPEVALAISNWLTSQRSYTGAFESTQDTVVALDALSKYAQSQSEGSLVSQQNPEQSPNLTCDVKLSNITKRSIEFSETNALVLQSFKLDQIQPISLGKEELEIVTSGSGVGTMSVKLKYNVLNEEDELCHFSVEPTITEWKPQIQATDVTFDSEIFRRAAVTVIEELDLSTVEGLGGSSQPIKRPAPTLRIRRSSPTHMIDLSERNSSSSSTSARDQLANTWTSWIKSKFKERFFKTTTNTSQTIQPNVAIATTTMIAPRAGSRPNQITHKSNVKQEDWPNIGDTSNRQQTSTERRNGTSRRSVAKEARSSDTGQPSSEINPLSANLSSPANQPQSASGVGSPATRLYLLLEVCVRYIYSRREPDMSVIEVKILSGFRPNKADLDEVLNAPGTPAYKYELSNDKSLVIFYLRTIPSSGPYCLQFRLISESTVRNLQSGYIRVYEYYTPTHSCSNYYTPSRQSELLRVNCDSGKVCQCASRSKCPATRKLSDLGEIQTVNATSARNQLSALACSDRFDFVSIVKLVSVRELKDQQRFKIYIKIKRDIKGNMTDIIEAQRRQSLQPNLRQQQYLPTDSASVASAGSDYTSNNDKLDVDEEDVRAPTDQLVLSIDTGCLKNDSLLIHLSYPNLRKQVGEQMILFGRYSKLDRGYFRVNPRGGSRTPASIAASRASGASSSSLTNDVKQLEFDDSNLIQYSTVMYLDRDSILHDMTFQEQEPLRKAMNSLTSWLELISRRKEWSCQKA